MQNNKILLLLTLLMSSLSTSGQEEPIRRDSLEVDSLPLSEKKKRKKINLKPTGFQLGLDLVPIGISVFDEKFQDYEANAILLLGDKFFVSTDLGFTQFSKEEIDFFSYQSQGTYVRLGLHYDFWHSQTKNTEGILSLGLGYALANFQQEVTFSVPNSYFGDTSGQEEQSALLASWAVGFASMKTQIFKNFFVGPVFRLKVRVSQSNTSSFDISEIPGYGENRALNVEFGYQVSYGF